MTGLEIPAKAVHFSISIPKNLRNMYTKEIWQPLLPKESTSSWLMLRLASYKPFKGKLEVKERLLRRQLMERLLRDNLRKKTTLKGKHLRVT